jgi:hypothetical protein
MKTQIFNLAIRMSSEGHITNADEVSDISAYKYQLSSFSLNRSQVWANSHAHHLSLREEALNMHSVFAASLSRFDNWSLLEDFDDDDFDD